MDSHFQDRCAFATLTRLIDVIGAGTDRTTTSSGQNAGHEAAEGGVRDDDLSSFGHPTMAAARTSESSSASSAARLGLRRPRPEPIAFRPRRLPEVGCSAVTERWFGLWWRNLSGAYPTDVWRRAAMRGWSVH